MPSMASTAIRPAAHVRHVRSKWPGACASPPTTMPRPTNSPAYAELHCLSDFSFLRGAASAEELFTRAARCGYEALAITDECSLAGIVRACEASRASGLKLIVGSEFRLDDGLRLVLLVETRAGYTQLCELITVRAAPRRKGEYRLTRDRHRGAVLRRRRARPVRAVAAGRRAGRGRGRWLRDVFGERALSCGGTASRTGRCARACDALLALAARIADARPSPAGDVHMDVRRQRVLQDTMTAIRHGLPLADCGAHLFRNGERHLRTRRALGNIYPHALAAGGGGSWRGAARSPWTRSSYRYPAELVPEGHTPATHLRALTEAGMRERWPEGAPRAHRRADRQGTGADRRAEEYEAFFLTVEDIVRFARGRGHPLPGPRLVGQFRGVFRARHHRRSTRPKAAC